MGTSDLIALLVVGALILAVLGAAFWKWYKKRHPLTAWIHKTSPPPNTDIALRVIRESLTWVAPDWRSKFGGEIEWTDDPYTYGYGPALAAGTVQDFEKPSIKLLRYPNVWDSALTHEILHVYKWRMGFDIGDGDVAFYAEVAALNAKIKTEIGASS